MRFLKFFLSLVITAGLVYLLNNPISHESLPQTIPPLGSLFCPFSGFWQNAESVADYESGDLKIEGLAAEVQVAYDEKMVPHIFAESEKDALRVQGYLTAQHRLFQMDFVTRYASGRLSEILGERTLETDKIQRRRGLLLAAEKAIIGYRKNPKEFEKLEAYSEGVNAYLATLKPKDYPIEYKLLDFKPEDWSPLKTALFIKYMALTLCSRELDIESTNTLEYFGQETFNFLYPEYNPKQSPIIPVGTPWGFRDSISGEPQPEALELIGYFEEPLLPKPSEFLGSNNWAVAGKKTASGNPILCSDPHLRLTLPSIWFEIQMHIPGSNSYGVSLPGVPGVIIGFNENIAWGQTNVGQDVLDWYKIKWSDDEKTHYWLDGDLKEVEELVENIWVKGVEQPIKDTVKYTHWGPVIYESKKHRKYDLACRWIALDESGSTELSVFTKMNKAKNYDDYAEALTHYSNPAQNYAFASKDGDIAITVSGKFPIKDNQQGRFVQDGSLTRNGWNGWIPNAQIPKVKNPARGFISSANQHSTDPSYPYYYNSASFDDYRGRILNRKLGEMEDIKAEDMMALQNDSYSIMAEESLPLLLENLDSNKLNVIQKQIHKKLKEWDYVFDAKSVTPALFDMWWDEFYEMTWDEIYAFKDSIEMLYPETWRTIELLKEQPNNRFFDNQQTETIESASDIVSASFGKMCEKMDSMILDLNFNWGTHKGTTIAHLGQLPGFSRPVSVSGYGMALNATRKSAGPSWRMVVELGDEIKAYGVYPGGQSGNPGSPHYDDQVEKWANGEYNELFFMKDKADDRMKTLFTLNFGS